MNFSSRWLKPFTKGNVFSRKKHQETLDALNPLLNIKVIGGRAVYSDQNVIIDTTKALTDSPSGGSSSLTILHPFKIYQVAPYTFQVRGGYIGYRPRNTAPNFGISNTGYFFTGNYEYRERCDVAGFDGTTSLIPVTGGYDPSEDFYNSRVAPPSGVSVETVNVGNVGDFGVSDLTKAGKFALNSTTTTFGGPAASFWAEIDDNTPGDLATIQLKCRMVGYAGNALSRTDAWFPSASGKIIPIGIVQQLDGNLGTSLPANPALLSIRQFVYDHQINRYPRGGLTSGLAGLTLSSQAPMFYMGLWDDAIHKDRYFYPGDAVTIDETLTVSGGPGLSVGVESLYVAATVVKGLAGGPPAAGWLRAST